MATVVRSIGIVGITGYVIAVQAKVLGGLSIMNIVGLGDQAVKEAKDRIESAFDQLGFIFPKKKIKFIFLRNGTSADRSGIRLSDFI
jgi:magnesium chelatase family protein